MSRLRRRKTTKEYLEKLEELVVLDPSQYKGKWQQTFASSSDEELQKNRPLRIELGMGKGNFISEMSALHPEADFIGMDMYDELVRKASEKAQVIWEEKRSEQPWNLKLALGNIERIEQFFAPGELERIYLNFSDPWPKTRHAHRRLTHPNFLRKYIELLNEDGEIHFKTDSLSLFEFSLNSFAELDLKLRNISLDLHRNGPVPGNVMTEYETKFVGRGLPIYRCEVLIGSRAIAKHREQQEQISRKMQEIAADEAESQEHDEEN
ncbi:tRNA (guanosine(46)-N7)-methyltransferase TrmB [Paenibacillus turpanensis]|uniref:tRNA (guanosine(46)-N7)-methyltransferase TrmB n=1 Tax=Paenibacillus turpanensis TaxID=2689078 RepID=UPI00140AC639|nr:tRNA (guanosine(46)-N7)-methyltransferase TrmB [Paenibacillus turpanensis]